MYLELMGSGGPLEAVIQHSREEVPMTWNKVAGVEGELGRFRMRFALCAAPWAFSLPPIPGALLPLCRVQSFLPVLVSHHQPLGEESTVSGLTTQQAAGEEAPSCALAPASCN